MHVDEWLQTIPALWVYILVGVVIGLESLGIPLPGEIVLVSSALLSAKGVVSPVVVGVCASAGAIIGDSIGYYIGRRGGQPLFDRLGRRFRGRPPVAPPRPTVNSHATATAAVRPIVRFRSKAGCQVTAPSRMT